MFDSSDDSDVPEVSQQFQALDSRVAIRIVGQEHTRYKVKWAGKDPRSGEPWSDSWVDKEEVSQDLVPSWERERETISPRKKSTSSLTRRQSSGGDRSSSTVHMSASTSTARVQASTSSSLGRRKSEQRDSVESIRSRPRSSSSRTTARAHSDRRESRSSRQPPQESSQSDSGSQSEAEDSPPPRPPRRRSQAGTSASVANHNSTRGSKRKLPDSPQREDKRSNKRQKVAFKKSASGSDGDDNDTEDESQPLTTNGRASRYHNARLEIKMEEESPSEDITPSTRSSPFLKPHASSRSKVEEKKPKRKDSSSRFSPSKKTNGKEIPQRSREECRPSEGKILSARSNRKQEQASAMEEPDTGEEQDEPTKTRRRGSSESPRQPHVVSARFTKVGPPKPKKAKKASLPAPMPPAGPSSHAASSLSKEKAGSRLSNRWAAPEIESDSDLVPKPRNPTRKSLPFAATRRAPAQGSSLDLSAAKPKRKPNTPASTPEEIPDDPASPPPAQQRRPLPGLSPVHSKKSLSDKSHAKEPLFLHDPDGKDARRAEACALIMGSDLDEVLGLTQRQYDVTIQSDDDSGSLSPIIHADPEPPASAPHRIVLNARSIVHDEDAVVPETSQEDANTSSSNVNSGSSQAQPNISAPIAPASSLRSKRLGPVPVISPSVFKPYEALTQSSQIEDFTSPIKGSVAPKNGRQKALEDSIEDADDEDNFSSQDQTRSPVVASQIDEQLSPKESKRGWGLGTLRRMLSSSKDKDESPKLQSSQPPPSSAIVKATQGGSPSQAPAAEPEESEEELSGPEVHPAEHDVHDVHADGSDEDRMDDSVDTQDQHSNGIELSYPPVNFLSQPMSSPKAQSPDLEDPADPPEDVQKEDQQTVSQNIDSSKGDHPSTIYDVGFGQGHSVETENGGLYEEGDDISPFHQDEPPLPVRSRQGSVYSQTTDVSTNTEDRMVHLLDEKEQIIQELRDSVQEYEEHVEELGAANKEFLQVNEEYIKQIEDNILFIKDLEKEQASLRQANEGLQTRVTSLEAMDATNKSKIVSAQKDADFFRKHYTKASNYTSELQQTARLWEEEKAELQLKLDIATRQASEGLASITAMFKKDRERVQADLTQVRNENELLKEMERRTQSEDIRRKAALYVELQEKHVSLKKDFKESIFERRRAEIAAEDATKQAESLDEVVRSKNDEIDTLRREIEALRKSHQEEVRAIEAEQGLNICCEWQIDAQTRCPHSFIHKEDLDAHYDLHAEGQVPIPVTPPAKVGLDSLD